jgi:hypothetical protein
MSDPRRFQPMAQRLFSIPPASDPRRRHQRLVPRTAPRPGCFDATPRALAPKSHHPRRPPLYSLASRANSACAEITRSTSAVRPRVPGPNTRFEHPKTLSANARPPEPASFQPRRTIHPHSLKPPIRCTETQLLFSSVAAKASRFAPRTTLAPKDRHHP